MANRFLSKRGVQIALGVLWLIDGALQLQPQMYTSNFASQVIAPAAQGQPWFVSNVIHLGVRVFLTNPAIFDTFFVIVQLSLGLLILRKQTARIGLISSVVWALFVWVVGEGYGGIFSAHTTILMGAPGAALLYAILALAVLPSRSTSEEQKQPHQQPAFWLALIWLATWVGGAIYQLLPGQNSVSDLSSMILGNAQGAPGWLASIDTHVAEFINGVGTSTASMAGTHMTAMQMAQMPLQQGSGYWFILLLAVVQLCVGLGVILPGIIRKSSIVIGIALSLVFWVVGQSLGGYYTGTATDPNSGPLFILLGLAVLGCLSLDQKLSKLGHRIEKIIVGSS